MSWDPQVYEIFARHRERPFLDLLCRINHPGARRVLDAGCGTGRTTVRLAEHFPDAQVLGVDASPEMLAHAPKADRPRFIHGDLRTWQPDAPADVVVANAVLHWLAEPENMLRRLAGWVAPGGVVAIQVPANFDEPSHRIIREAAASTGMSVEMGDHVLELEEYARVLEDLEFDVDAWETTYRMRLPPGGVLEWLKATTLRPYMEALGGGAPAWLDELGQRLDQAYPADEQGVVFPFRRRFVLGHRPT